MVANPLKIKDLTSEQSRSRIIIVVVSVIVSVILIAVKMLHDLEKVAREHAVNANCKYLSMVIEVYREQEGYYPRSFEELLSTDYEDEKGKQSISNLINSTLHNAWHDSYDYKASTNGFTFTVSGPDIGPAGWFGKQRKVERHYQMGEALKNHGNQ